MFLKKKKIEELIFNSDVVGCVGKLPIHMEFIKQRINLPEIATLDQWYQNAYHYVSRQYGNDFKSIFSQMPLYHFCYITAQRLPLLGTLIASQDQSGRSYPYIIFRLAEHPLAKEWPLLLPILYQDFYSSSRELCEAKLNCSLPELYETVNLLNQTNTVITKRDILEKSLKSLQQTSLAEFWRGISTIHPTIKLEYFIAATLEQMAVFKARVLQNQFVGIRLPIASLYSASCVIFWLQFFNTLISELQQCLQIFWNPNEKNGKGNLLIYFKPIPTNCFAHFLNQSSTQDHLLDVIALAETKTNSLEKINNINVDLSASLLQTLQKWNKPKIV